MQLLHVRAHVSGVRIYPHVPKKSVVMPNLHSSPMRLSYNFVTNAQLLRHWGRINSIGRISDSTVQSKRSCLVREVKNVVVHFVRTHLLPVRDPIDTRHAVLPSSKFQRKHVEHPHLGGLN